MQPHVVEPLHVRQVILPDGKAELRLVDLDPGGAEPVQQLERAADLIAPGLVAQLDGDRVAGEGPQQRREVVPRRRAVFEACWKLREQRAEAAARRQGIDPAAEGVDVGIVGLRQRIEQR